MVENAVQKKDSVVPAGVYITLMAIYFVVPSQGAVLAALADMAVAFPDVDPSLFGYMVSIVALAQIIASIVAGAVAGKKISYKMLLVIAIALYLVAGLIPYFIPDGGSFELILVSRFVFGLGIGCFKPMADALIAACFSDEGKRAGAYGFGNAFFNIGAIVFQMAGGFLCLISWQTTFLVYLLGIIPLLCVLFAFKEPEKAEVSADKPKQKVSIPISVWALFVMFLLTQIFQYPTFVYLSQFMAEAGLGDSAMAGTLLSAITLIGIVVAIFFGGIYRALKKMALPISAFCVAIGELCVYFACVNVSMPLMIFAVLIFGAGATIMMAGLSQEVARLVNPATAAIAMGFLSAFMNVGTFAATPYTTLVSSATGGLLSTMIIGPVAIVVIGIIFMVIAFKAKPAEDSAVTG